tara:strand:- start:120 stop:263 length:144 start_codon:yes stop_codon:yes gene_type:complete
VRRKLPPVLVTRRQQHGSRLNRRERAVLALTSKRGSKQVKLFRALAE